jgi:hypothetical protein
MLQPCVCATLVPTCVRPWVPPPQEAEQAAQAVHSRAAPVEVGQVATRQACFLVHVLLGPHRRLRCWVPAPQEAEHWLQALHGALGRGEAGRTGGEGVVRMSTGQEAGQ